jgi:hypothetical protein
MASMLKIVDPGATETAPPPSVPEFKPLAICSQRCAQICRHCWPA